MTHYQSNNSQSIPQLSQHQTQTNQYNKQQDQPILTSQQKPTNQSQTETQIPKIHVPQKQPITINLITDKLNDATTSKNKGNSFFKKKNYVAAIQQYSIALRILDPNYFYTATEDERIKMAELSSSLLYNLGFCYFNSHDMVRSELFLSEAIIINPKYTKAIHKRALARYQQGKYQQSFLDIKLAFSLDRSNPQIHASYSKILSKYNQQARQNKEKMKQLSTKIFSSQKQIQSNQTLEKKQSKNSAWSWPLAVGILTATAIIGVVVKAISKK